MPAHPWRRRVPWPVLVLGLSLGGCAGSHDGVVAWDDHGPETRPVDLAVLKGVYEYRNGSLANEMIRIVAIDGRQVPREFGVAEGADAVMLRPGLHDVKLLWVHGDNYVDHFAYGTVQVDTQANCLYRFHSAFGNPEAEVRFDVTFVPTTPGGNQQCGRGAVSQKHLEGGTSDPADPGRDSRTPLPPTSLPGGLRN
jgi:hypothetical protein